MKIVRNIARKLYYGVWWGFQRKLGINPYIGVVRRAMKQALKARKKATRLSA